MTLPSNNYENQLTFDEEKLLNSMLDQRGMMASKNKWINFRRQCIQHMSGSGESSINFYEKFIRLAHKIDPVYYEQNEELFEFLYQFILWKSNDLKNIDTIINRLSEMYEKSLRENNETLICQLRFVTQALLDKLIDRHGSGVIVKLRNSFEVICKRTQDYEMLYILWRKLFER